MTTAHEIAMSLRDDMRILWARAPIVVRTVIERDVLRMMDRLDQLIDLTDEDKDDDNHGQG